MLGTAVLETMKVLCSKWPTVMWFLMFPFSYVCHFVDNCFLLFY